MSIQEKINAVMASLDNAIVELKTVKEVTRAEFNIIQLEAAIDKIDHAIDNLDNLDY